MINLSFSDAKFIQGEVTLAGFNANELATDKDFGPVMIRTGFINYLSYDVTVIMRNGLRHTVPFIPRPNTEDKVFIIRDTYTIRSSSFEEFKRMATVITNGPVPMPTLQAIEENFYSRYFKGPSTTVHVTIDTNLDSDSITEVKAGVYLTNKDYLISSESLFKAQPHPFSDHTTVVRKFEEMCNINSSLNFYVEMIDNENQLGNRYIYLGDIVHEIKTSQDINKATGIYFGTFNRDDEGNINVTTKYLTVKEAEETIGLYKTREEAINKGDAELARKETITRLLHETTLNKIALEEKSNEFKVEQERLKNKFTLMEGELNLQNLKLAQELKALESKNNILDSTLKQERLDSEKRLINLKEEYEHKKNEYDTKRLRDDDYYSQRSHERKDSSEFIKTLPALIIGGIGLATLLFKM